MGRYYSGDIEGKFWFGVQSSDAAERFGVKGEVTYLSYSFDSGDVDEIKGELKRIEDNLGEQFTLMQEFFKDAKSYSDIDLIDKGINPKKLSEYADYLLGKQILECVEEQGYCSFDAEL